MGYFVFGAGFVVGAVIGSWITLYFLAILTVNHNKKEDG